MLPQSRTLEAPAADNLRGVEKRAGHTSGSPVQGNTGQSTRTNRAWKAPRLMRYPLRGPR